MSTDRAPQAHFRCLEEASAEDWLLLEATERAAREQRPGEGLLQLLRAFEQADPQGAPLNVYAHCLQTASRVLEAGGDEELVVVALFHDLPECLSEAHHGELAAQLLAPYVSEQRRWLLARHVEFQAFHFKNHPRRDRHEREAFRGHPMFEATALFCERFDQLAFDPRYPTRPLTDFVPLVRRVCAPGRPLAQPKR